MELNFHHPLLPLPASPVRKLISVKTGVQVGLVGFLGLPAALMSLVLV